MTLEEIQNSLIENFDFDQALEILHKLGEDYKKEDLIQISKGLIKMLYQSREMDNVFFTSGHLEASRGYIGGSEVSYSLNLLIELSSELTYELEVPFDSIDEEDELKNELENLLELNKKEYELNEENDLAQANILKLEKILLRLE